MGVGCRCRHSTYRLDIVKLDVLVVEQRGESVSVWHGGCILAVVLGYLMSLGCCYSWGCGSMDDIGSVVCFRCGNSVVRSVDDTIRYCFLQFGVSCLKCFRFGFDSRIGCGESAMLV